MPTDLSRVRICKWCNIATTRIGMQRMKDAKHKKIFQRLRNGESSRGNIVLPTTTAAPRVFPLMRAPPKENAVPRFRRVIAIYGRRT